MAGRQSPVRRASRAARLLLATVVLLAGCTVTAPGADDAPTPVELRVLQVNLCSSGLAGCHTGEAPARAAELVRAERPDVVTLNEACRDDLELLRAAMAAVHGDDAVAPAFAPARNRRTGGPYHCLNGQEYGVGVVAHVPTGDREHAVHSGIYPAQDPDDPEERAWLCVEAGSAYQACTTHLAYTSSTLALAQCNHLLGTAIPQLHADSRYRPTVVSGDLNLRHGGTPDVRACVPVDYQHRHDGGVQQFMATDDLPIGSTRAIGMDGTTDHPAFLVSLTLTH
ncbi:endonuclease/exonuclease/phosphatase family protein [Micromonospora sp. SH-82]|uniref:endonuclease/exonuclease/phosphatase family protein n=1 Tax=Micromonospora sp. SH-82 TaxID=3132938 RepID=UPI003EB82092